METELEEVSKKLHEFIKRAGDDFDALWTEINEIRTKLGIEPRDVPAVPLQWKNVIMLENLMKAEAAERQEQEFDHEEETDRQEWL